MLRRRKNATIGALGVSLAMMLGVAGVATPAIADTLAVVPDDTLAECVNAELLRSWNKPLADPLTVEWIARLSGLNCDGVADLAGLENATSLRYLYLYDGTITSLAPLAGNTTLVNLTVGGYLGELTSWISDLTPINDSPDLEVLAIANVSATTLPDVATMPNLRSLSLGGTQIEDLTPLKNHPSLESLSLWGSHVTDIAPLATLPLLTSLDLEDAPLSDLSPLASLDGLTQLSLAGTTVSDLSPLSQLAGITNLNIDRTAVPDLKVLAGFTGLSELSFQYTPISSLEGLGDLTSLGWFNGTGAALSDASFDGEASAKLDEQRVIYGSVTSDTTVANPLRGFHGEVLAPTAESLTAAHAVLSADSSELVFSQPGVYTLTWSHEPPESGGEFLRLFAGTIEFTVEAPKPPTDPPTKPPVDPPTKPPVDPTPPPTAPPLPPPAPPAPPAPPVAQPAGVLAETGFGLAGWAIPAVFMLLGGGILLIRVRRRA